jgi:serine/threonine-protein kinase
MSPEQASGRKDIDARTDQYSLGVCVYQMLTGVRPYETDDSMHVVAKILAGAKFKTPHEINPAIPVAVDAVVMRALERDREARFPNIDEMLSALRKAIEDDKTIILPAAPTEDDATRIQPLAAPLTKPKADELSGTVPPMTRRSAASARVGNIGSAVAVVISLGLAGVILYQQINKSSSPPPPATTTVVVAPTTPTVTATATATATETVTAPVTATATATATAPATVTATATQTAEPPRARDAGARKTNTTATSAPCTPTPGAPCF